MKSIVVFILMIALLAAMFTLPAHSSDEQIPDYENSFTKRAVKPKIDADTLLQAKKAFFDTLVEKGAVTQEKADLSLEKFKQRLEKGRGFSKSSGRGFGRGWRRGLGRGFGKGMGKGLGKGLDRGFDKDLDKDLDKRDSSGVQ